MKKTKHTASSPDPMQEEYDFSKGVRGKYAKRFEEGSNIVLLDPDLAKLYPDSESVNRALRSLPQPEPRYAREEGDD